MIDCFVLFVVIECQGKIEITNLENEEDQDRVLLQVAFLQERSLEIDVTRRYVAINFSNYDWTYAFFRAEVMVAQSVEAIKRVLGIVKAAVEIGIMIETEERKNMIVVKKSDVRNPPKL